MEAVARIIFLLLVLCASLHVISGTQPHLVVILADDLGFSDVGWRNPALHTPTLDRLAREGVVLSQSYVQPTCSPSRAALMTGKYPYTMGLQHGGINSGHLTYLPTGQPILPETLKSLGYATHMVGKWHLGFCAWKYTPMYRGFDSFYGFYSAAEDYFTHLAHRDGYDFRDGNEVDWTAKGQYSTNLLTERAVKIMREHNASQPLFLYIAYQAVHGPLEVPEHYKTEYCSHITDPDRKTKCGMIAALDEGVANVTQALEETGLASNTFLLFSSDNGGPVETGGSSNWPLRGAKGTIWEGGTRAAAFMHAPNLLHRTGYEYDEIIHLVDWYPTFVEAAGGSSIANINGVSQWRNLLAGSSGPRDEFIYNIDEVFNNSAIRQGHYKLVQGHMNGHDGWFAPPEMANETTHELHIPRRDEKPYQLFDLHNDPEEKHDISADHPDVVQRLLTKVNEYHATLVLYDHRADDFVHESHPKFFNDVWSPGWC